MNLLLAFYIYGSRYTTFSSGAPKSFSNLSRASPISSFAKEIFSTSLALR